MDILDGSNNTKVLEWIKAIEKTNAKDKQEKGQLVQDHPEKSTVVTQFMAKLLGKCILTPSSTPGAGFVEMIMGTAYPFPNGKLIDESLKTIPITQVPEPYPPCTLEEKDLKSIRISDMRLDTHHRGTKVLLHTLSAPDRNDAIMVIVEDEGDTAVLMKLYQQEDEKKVPCNSFLGNSEVFFVKEPFFKRSYDNDSDGPLMVRSAYYSLRVDHPSDIIFLHKNDERIPQKWRDDILNIDKSSLEWRNEGNKSFRDKQWASAQLSFSEALEKAETVQDKQLAQLNRSLTNLKLGRPAKALLDVTRAYDLNKPSEKALFRHANALYMLQKFEQCEAMIRTLLEAYPDSQAAKVMMERVQSRLLEQRTGTYSFQKMYEQVKTMAGPPSIDCATFSGLVEIRDSPGRGRGLFTTKPVSAGDLLLVEKAFSYSFMDETRLMDQVTYMVNFNTKFITAGASANLWPKVVHKLYHDPDALSIFEELCNGGYKKVDSHHCDGVPIVDSFLVERILSLNSFGSPRTTRDFCKDNIWSGKVTPSSRERPIFTTAGVWLLAARINHSCVGNCRRSFIGDVQIIRAARDLPAGTELTFPYRPSTQSESYQAVQKNLAKWGLICDCELCKDRRKTTEAVRVQRKELHDDFMSQLPSDEDFDFNKATKLLRVIEKTYRGKPAKQIRWVLADLYAYVGIRCRQDGEFVDAAKMLIKALEAMGFVIAATSPEDAGGQPRFEVKHWGMVEHHIPWLFFQLIECYHEINPWLIPAAEHYTRLAYSIIVGESESMWDVLPATGSQKE
ncbi:hypothetical protein FLONG3_1839 [Fusarium longipes]|uniref:SET domain-containing protein n=1 Tax=Fusarium longipes TaxID=694270 RepID=A0A395T5S8_9HYPO|nr:hypothetical protein FLONG3_1839 [Fusarium longipes]